MKILLGIIIVLVLLLAVFVYLPQIVDCYASGGVPVQGVGTYACLK